MLHAGGAASSTASFLVRGAVVIDARASGDGDTGPGQGEGALDETGRNSVRDLE